VEVAEIIDESQGCRSFYLIDPYRQPLPGFRPGQFVMVRPALAGAYQTSRCYSLSSAPDPRYWRITVKRQSEGAFNRRQKSGGLSAWLHDTIRVGDCLLVGGPSGQFFLTDCNVRPLVLLAAGVGITPMASMLRWSLEHTPRRPIGLLYQAKDIEHWPLGPSLHRWQAGHPSVCQVRSYFSRLDAPALVSLQLDLPGKILPGKFSAQQACTLASEDLGVQPGDSDYFMCGPNEWMESLRAELMNAGVASKHIHWESFGGVAGTKSPTETSPETLSVRFTHSGVELAWNDPEQSLWELARANNIELPSGCLSGVCGCCRVKLISGQVHYDRVVGAELAEDECLTCIARPKSSIAIDA
jgi:ferredoxin-NADP reductase